MVRPRRSPPSAEAALPHIQQPVRVRCCRGSTCAEEPSENAGGAWTPLNATRKNPAAYSPTYRRSRRLTLRCWTPSASESSLLPYKGKGGGRGRCGGVHGPGGGSSRSSQVRCGLRRRGCRSLGPGGRRPPCSAEPAATGRAAGDAPGGPSRHGIALAPQPGRTPPRGCLPAQASGKAAHGALCPGPGVAFGEGESQLGLQEGAR